MHIIGAGGHAKVVIDTLLQTLEEIEGIWDDRDGLSSVLGHFILGNSEQFKAVKGSTAIIAIGDNQVRKKIAHALACNFGRAVHPKSAVSPAATIGAGTVVMANASVNAGAIVGQHVIVNTNASIDHDCQLGDFVHISPQAAVGGGVHIGEGTHIGIGASVMHGITIGKWAVIGAGATVIRDIPDYAVAVGNPARIIKYNSI